jgi:hypothetical protein
LDIGQEGFETHSYTFQVSNFNVLEGDNHEWRLGQLHQAIGGGLDNDIGSAWNAVEAEVAEGHVDLEAFVATGILNLLGKVEEELVEFGAAATFLLFLFKLFFVAVPMLTLSITGFVELHFCCLAEELHVPGLPLANHDGVDQIQVNDDDELVLRRLEEQVLDVVEEDIDLIVAIGVDVSQTVLMNLDGSRSTLAVNGGTKEDDVKALRSAVNDELILLDDVFELFLLLLATHGFLLHLGDLIDNVLHSRRVL